MDEPLDLLLKYLLCWGAIFLLGALLKWCDKDDEGRE
jgi:hypothetical protein